MHTSGVSLDALLPKLCCPECRPPAALVQGDGVLLCLRHPEHAFPLVEGTPILFKQAMLWDFLQSHQRQRGGNQKGQDGEDIIGGAYHWRLFSIEDLLVPLPRGDVLIVGCGDAGERPYLDHLGFRSMAFDVRADSGADFLADAHSIPIQDSAFDIVLSMQVLEHLTEPWVGVGEIARVLRPGGWFVGSVAFLEEHHSSFFHMSHDGVLHLLQSHGLRVDRIAGVRSAFYGTLRSMFPMGSRSISRAIYGAIDDLLFGARARMWSLSRRLDPDQPTDRFKQGMPMSFRTFDRLRFARWVVFRAQKQDGPALGA